MMIEPAKEPEGPEIEAITREIRRLEDTIKFSKQSLAEYEEELKTYQSILVKLRGVKV